MSIQAASSVCMTVHVCVCSVHNIHLSPMRKTTFEPIFTKKSSAAPKVYLPGKGDGRAVLVRVNHTAGFLGRAPWPAPRCHAQLHTDPSRTLSRVAPRSESHPDPSRTPVRIAHRSKSHIDPSRTSIRVAHRSESHTDPSRTPIRVAPGSESHPDPSRTPVRVAHRSKSHTDP
jgi:hypothetical protein